MAWNPKALRVLKTQPAGLDRFDREAEREGTARNYFNRNDLGPAVLGRRISKESRKADGYAKTAEQKATAFLIKETARIVAERTTRPQQLAQV